VSCGGWLRPLAHKMPNGAFPLSAANRIPVKEPNGGTACHRSAAPTAAAGIALLEIDYGLSRDHVRHLSKQS
jgi:hypothetical protein